MPLSICRVATGRWAFPDGPAHPSSRGDDQEARDLGTSGGRVEVVSFEVAQIQALLIDGLVLDGCEVRSDRVLATAGRPH